MGAAESPPDWGGLSNALTRAGVASDRLGVSTLSLGEIGSDATVVVPTSAHLDAAEVDALRAFADGGGRVLVLANADAARAWGIAVASQPARVADGTALNVSWATGRAAAALAYPLVGPGRVLLVSDNATFVDADGDGREGAGDVAGPFVLGVAVDRVVVLGLPRVEGAFADEVVRAAIPSGSRVLLDEAHASRGDGWALAALRLAHEPILAALLGAPLVVGSACLAFGASRRSARSDGRTLADPMPWRSLR